MSNLESRGIPDHQTRLKAARVSIRLAQEEVDEFFNPNTHPDRKDDLRKILLEKLADPFEELGYLQGNREGDDRAIDLLGDLLMGFVKYDPAKARLVTFVERILRNKGIDDHRMRTRWQKKTQAGHEERLAKVTYANTLLEFSENFPLVETIEKEIPNFRIEADREMCRAL
ncbi:MAG: hypothetical protein FJ308_23265, partial [Planctomycetes bacterium]|nr:hypothetical protein [Planctomycetota bacterium]